MTQTHTVPENALLNKFILVNKKPHNTFSHVLYIIHKDTVFCENMLVEPCGMNALIRCKNSLLLYESKKDKEI
jgi:hypothetical protein